VTISKLSPLALSEVSPALAWQRVSTNVGGSSKLGFEIIS